MNSVTVSHLRDLDPQAWGESYARGHAPGATPYGLHRLMEYGWSVDYELVDPAGRNPYRWLPALRQLRRSRLRPTRTRTVLAWDERGGVGMYGRHAEDPVRLGCGVIWATDQLQRSEGRLRLLALRSILRRMDFVWCLSRGQLDTLRNWLGVDVPESSLVPFGIDTDFFPVQPWPAQPLIFSLGNDRDRDIATLYQALTQVRAQRPNVRIVVQTASNAPAPAGVIVHRTLSAAEIKSLYAAATLVVISTRRNLHVSGVTASLEAMSSGRPVVISGTAGMEDYVKEGVHGRLAVPEDARSVASAVVASLDDEAGLASMGAAAAVHVRQHHTESSMCHAISRLAAGEA